MFVRAAAWWVARVPLAVVQVVAGTLAWVWWLVLPFRRRVAVDNLSQALPDVPVGPTLRRAMTDLIAGFVEWVRHPRSGDVALEIVGFERVDALLADGVGVILAGNHTMMWDFGGGELNRLKGYDMLALVKRPADPGSADLAADIRAWYRVPLVYAERGAMTELVTALRAGRLVIFHVDQRHNEGIAVPFFGRPAWSSPATALVAARSGAPVFGIGYERLGAGRHRVTLHRELSMTGDVETDTATLQAFVEELVRDQPHNWLWLHDRWRQP